MQKLRVGVLMGGKSIEKEVSFLSGRTICDHLDTMRYDIIPLFQSDTTLYLLPWHFLHRGKTTDFEHRLAQEAEKISWDDLKKRTDFIYIAQHGRYAEDGILQGFLEVLAIPYLGSGIFASAVRMDKIIQKSFLANAAIAIPRYTVIYPEEIEHYAQREHTIIEKMVSANIGQNYVVKPYNEGSSLGISVLSDYLQLESALRTACYIEPGKKKKVLVEEKIIGMEFTCIILFDYLTNTYLPLPPTEVIYEKDTHFLDYEQKYMPGRGTKITPARCSTAITNNIQNTCIAVMKALNFTTIGRIDGFVTADETIVIIDPNTLSGMSPSCFIFNQAAQIGMSPTHLINHLIETELHAYGIDYLPAHQNTLVKEKNSMLTQKMRVAVLFGGKTHEKETSLDSGRNVFYKLSPHLYQAIPLFITNNMELYHITQKQLVHHSTKEIEAELDESQKIAWSNLSAITDFVFIALHGGEGENGAIQGLLEMLELPYNGSSIFASALCMDKYKTAQFLAMHGFDVPHSMLIMRDEWSQNSDSLCNTIISTILLPCIVKPHDDGCSVMVHKAETIEQLHSAIIALFSAGKTVALIEECIIGMELTVGVLGNDAPRALPPSQAVAMHGILSIEEKFLPGAGENQTPAPLSHEILQLVQQTIERVYTTVQCTGYARIDCFYQSADVSPTKKERIVILEINTLPGLTPATCLFHQAAEIGLRPMEFIDEIIKLGWEQHKKSIAITKQIVETNCIEKIV